MYASAYDRRRSVLVIDGGFTQDPGSAWGPAVAANNSTWEWDGTLGTWSNRSIPTAPHPIVLNSMLLAFDVSRNRMVAIAGTSNTRGDPVDQIWSWDPTTAMWTNLGCDSPYAGPPHLGFYDDSRDLIWSVDGNQNGGSLLLSSCRWTSYNLPVTAQTNGVFGVAFDTQRKLTYLVDGENVAGMVWEWSGAAPKQRPAEGALPPVRRYNNAAFDEDRGRLMMFSGGTRASGGAASEYPTDLWEWDPASGGWTLCASGSGGPAGRADATLVWDGKRHALLLLGGFSTDDQGKAQSHADIWEWAAP
jgi:hypothetical protein